MQNEAMEDRNLQLRNEARLGRLAKQSYDGFVKGFLKNKIDTLVAEFLSTEPDDKERLAEIRRMTLAIEALENDFLSEIQTGEMAARQLNEDNNG